MRQNQQNNVLRLKREAEKQAEEKRLSEIKNKVAELFMLYDESEIVDAIFETTGTEWNKPGDFRFYDHLLTKLAAENLDEKAVAIINEETNTPFVKEIYEEDMIKELRDSGHVIFKPMYGYQADMLREFAENEVFTYYSDQQTCIL